MRRRTSRAGPTASGAASAAREAGTPVEASELDRLFAPLTRYGTAILAVSGGADSMALMHLAAAWAGAVPKRPRLLVVTVDHGLRAESAAEAEWVGKQARRLGIPHEVLCWQGEKPATGIQQAARNARYALLAERARRAPPPCAIVTAHHQDDQAETLLMRLARGSGLDGLSAMREIERLPLSAPAPDIVRPLLEVPGARLTATLERDGLPWLEDPSNESCAFERVRLRKARAQLAEVGLTNAQIALSARRLRRAQQALEQAAADLCGKAVDLHCGAYASIDRAAYDEAPVELRLRVLLRVLKAVGGEQEYAKLAKAEQLVERLQGTAKAAATLGGCIVSPARDTIRVFREPGRHGLPTVALAPGESAVWDGRFLVRAQPSARGPAEVRGLGESGYATLRARLGHDFPLPRRAAITLPSFWRGEALLAVPHPGLEQAMADEMGREAGCYEAVSLWHS